MAKNQVCLFFYVQGRFLIHGCDLKEAEAYGDFLVYPDSHFEIWDRFYYDTYGVDFDYFPRGRVAYNKAEKKYYLYYDTCIENKVQSLIDSYDSGDVLLKYDEHYQCSKCNLNYKV
ncbi:MAG: hypothetical protein Q4B14_07180 [Clostridia bacterium]|nr:hypothetical protein [Clostridia bacterium]